MRQVCAALETRDVMSNDLETVRGGKQPSLKHGLIDISVRVAQFNLGELNQRVKRKSF